jgi:hypothetical protein
MAKSHNPVAKFSPRYNKAKVYRDRKREEKKTQKIQINQEMKMLDSCGANIGLEL